MKRIASAVLVLIAVITVLCGCSNDGYTPPADIGDADAYYSDWLRLTSADKICAPKKINIKSGKVVYACTDPLCDHTDNSKTCFFSYKNNLVQVFCYADAGDHLYFLARLNGERVVRLYDHDFVKNKLTMVYQCNDASRANYIKYYNKKIYFCIPELRTEEDIELNRYGILRLLEYDPETGRVNIADEMNVKAEDYDGFEYSSASILYWVDGGFVRHGHSDDPERESYVVYNLKDKTMTPIKAPENAEFTFDGYKIISSGYAYKYFAPCGLYLYDEEKYVELPNVGMITKIVRDKKNDTFVYGTTEPGFQTIGRDKNGDDFTWYVYNNEIYVVGRDGKSKHYTFDCPYHFIVDQAYDNAVIGVVQYKIEEDGTVSTISTGLEVTLIQLDLDTGKGTLYNSDSRENFVVGNVQVKISVE